MKRLILLFMFGLMAFIPTAVNAQTTTGLDAGSYGTGNIGGYAPSTTPGGACTCPDGSPGTLSMSPTSADGGMQGYGQTCNCPSSLGTGTNSPMVRDY